MTARLTFFAMNTKRSRFKRVLTAAVGAVALLAVIQTLTYVLYAGHAEAAMPRMGLRHLADYAYLRDCQFIVVDPETWEALSEAQRADLSAELASFGATIYHSRDQVPEDAIESVSITAKDREDYERWKELSWISAETLEAERREIESGRRIVGFKKGIEVHWRMDGRGLFWMECTAGHWVSIRGAESRTDIYVWVLYRWVRVRNTSHVMA